MSEYYKGKRTRYIYDPRSDKPFKISRSKLELFKQCPKCFYVDRKLGVGRPPGFPFTLNNAVDHLLKKEFDIYRAKGTKHPLIEKYEIDAIPIPHEDLDKWRTNFVGIQYHHKKTNLILSGAIDDLWQNSGGEFIVVDYKATAINEEITELNKPWQDGYKRQMEIYQWLLRKNGHKVSDTGYFVYCNGRKDKKAFNAKLEFDINLITFVGSDDWVESVVIKVHECLNREAVPEPSDNCDYCTYRKAVEEVCG